MTPKTAAQALADATSALTREHDVTDILAKLVRDCAVVLSAEAVGVLVLTAQDDLELLASSSHQAAELQTYQIQYESGPSIDAIHASASVAVSGDDEIRARWPQAGSIIIDAGYRVVQAYPLCWHGRAFGALNVFRAQPHVVGSESALLAQAFADIAAIVIVQNTDVDLPLVSARVAEALAARTAIEQAKGVLAYQHGLDMAAAYDLLVDLVPDNSTLTETATEIIAAAQRRRD